MANNCLVTKLKGVVNNSNIPYLGEFEFIFKIKEDTVDRVKDFSIMSLSTEIEWESDKDLYDRETTNPNRTNLGRHGTFIGYKQMWASETTNIKIRKMYGISAISTHTRFNGQINLDKLKINGDNFNVQGHRSFGLYGHLDKINYTVNITDNGYGVQLPLSLNLKYDKVTVPDDCICTLLNQNHDIYETSKYEFVDKFTQDNVEDGADLCGILNGTNIAKNLTNITYGQSNIFSISDVTMFNYQNCPKLKSIAIHELKYIGGDFISAFKDNPNFVMLSMKDSSKNTRIELRPLLEGWKAAGKGTPGTEASCSFWGPFYTIDGEDLPSKSCIFTFDSNGDWTWE